MTRTWGCRSTLRTTANSKSGGRTIKLRRSVTGSLNFLNPEAAKRAQKRVKAADFQEFSANIDFKPTLKIFLTDLLKRSCGGPKHGLETKTPGREAGGKDGRVCVEKSGPTPDRTECSLGKPVW
jgi:hypothetical protein